MKLREYIRKEIKLICEIGYHSHFYAVSNDTDKSLKISYYKFTYQLLSLMRKQGVDLEETFYFKEWKTVDKYLDKALSGINNDTHRSVDIDRNKGKSTVTTDNKDTLKMKIRFWLNLYWEKILKELDNAAN